jgi:hypothetical protein
MRSTATQVARKRHERNDLAGEVMMLRRQIAMGFIRGGLGFARRHWRCEDVVNRPPNGLEPSCPAEAGRLTRIVAHAGGPGAAPRAPARRSASLASSKTSGRCPHRTCGAAQAVSPRRGAGARGPYGVSGGSELLGGRRLVRWPWRGHSARLPHIQVAVVHGGPS